MHASVLPMSAASYDFLRLAPAQVASLTDTLRGMTVSSPPPPYSSPLSWMDDHKIPLDLEKINSSNGSDSDEDGRPRVTRARTALTSAYYPFSVTPAVDSDIQPPSLRFHISLSNDLTREIFNRSQDTLSAQKRLCDSAPTCVGTGFSGIDLTTLRMGGRDTSGPLLHNPAAGPYTISTNPPNPKTSFRLGDWICTVANCAAHNFGRNVSCIGCGRGRSEVPPSTMQHRNESFDFSPVGCVSPRFSSSSVPRDQLCRPLIPHIRTANLAMPPHSRPSPMSAPPIPAVKSASPYTPLTPSGHALSVGGRVQNVSKDPLAPCIMYWPDNEPLPEQGQIRPSGSAIITYPPIINTGNKGAAEKQPGDWICHKCHYLNWRRRKVCQTCFPYAEGNGDSISAAVQAERIALLENVLASQAQAVCGHAHTHAHERWHSVESPVRASAAPYADAELPPFLKLASRRDSFGSYELFSTDAPSRPIYQTHGRPGSGPPPFAYAPPLGADAEASMTLLPSFLQDIVQSPALSPTTSSSSADLSLEDCDAPLQPTPRAYKTGAAFGLRGGSIWKLDGEESRTLAVYSTSSTSSASSSPAGPGREGDPSR